MPIYIFKLDKKKIFILLSIVLLIGLGIVLTSAYEINTVSATKEYKPIYSGNPQTNGVAFGCNVVWGTEYVPILLEIAQNHNIKFTFFLGGQWAEENPQLVSQMYKQGHEIGNHGFYHKHHSKLSIEQNKEEIKKTEEIIEGIIGKKTGLFAPPYGDFNKTTLMVAEELGYKTIMWSIDTIDWKKPGATTIINRVLKKLHPGAIILIHPTEDTVAALPSLLEEIKKRGYEVKRISEII